MAIKECCKDVDNLELIEENDDGSTVKRCKVCGAKHYHMFMDVGNLSMDGEALGPE